MTHKIAYQFKPIDFFENKEIVLRCSSKPKISIIIPVYNQLLYTMNCLFSLIEECNKHEVEIVVINDNSTDDTDLFLNRVRGIKIVNNESNLGFLKNINKGLRVVNGDFALLLNNDVILLPNILSELLHVFETKDNVGAVGAMAIHPTGVLLEAGSKVFENGKATNLGREKSPYNPHYNYLRSVDYCSGYCLLIKKKFPNGELVQLDELFLPAYYEETDLCMQLKHDYNLSIYYQPFAKLIHFESISYSDSKKDVKDQLINNNRSKFQKKWNKVLKQPLVEINGFEPDYINSSRHKILYLDDVIENEFLERLITQEKKQKHIILVLKSKNKFEKNVIEKLQRQGVEVLYPYTTSKFKNRSYFKIIKRILPYCVELNTKNVFYILYSKVINKKTQIN